MTAPTTETDLIERLRNIAESKASSNRDVGRRGKQWSRESEIEWQAADRIAALEAAVYEHKTAADAFEACWKDAKAALEAEASEGERRGLERAAKVANSDADERIGSLQADAGRRIRDAIRALIPEAPAREGE